MSNNTADTIDKIRKDKVTHVSVSIFRISEIKSKILALLYLTVCWNKSLSRIRFNTEY